MARSSETILAHEEEMRLSNLAKAAAKDAKLLSESVRIERKEPGDKIRRRICHKNDLQHFREEGYLPIADVNKKSG